MKLNDCERMEERGEEEMKINEKVAFNLKSSEKRGTRPR